MNAKQKKLLAAGVVLVFVADDLIGWRILTGGRNRLRPAGYPYMGQPGGAGPGQQGSGGRSPGQ